MKKTIISLAAVLLASAPAMAGGLLTNINQNAAYLRNFAQEGQITLTSLYANPAGNAFLSPGWHFSLNSQTAIQERNIDTRFGNATTPMFSLNSSNPNDTHKFKGTALAPVIPSFTVSHNWDRWSLSAHFALVGGGGKCTFDDGLGSFEAKYASQLVPGLPMVAAGVNQAILPMMGNVQAGVQNNVAAQISAGMQANGMDAATADAKAAALAGMGTYNATPASRATGYDLNAHMKGRSYYFGLQVGSSYKITDNVSAYMGVRAVYATCNYNGYVQDIKANYVAAADYTYDVPAIPGAFGGTQGSGSMDLQEGSQTLNDNELTLDCDQTGFGLSPIVGLDWKINDKWNVALKYEAAARLSLKNKTDMNNVAKAQAEDPESPLHAYQDGKKVRSDIPAILAIGAEYSPIENVRIDASFKTYFEKSAADRGKMDDLGNTLEACLGAEYDVNKLITISASWQSTNYNMKDPYMNDLSFNLSSNSLGLGVRIHPSKVFNIDLGYMHTFYKDRSVTTLDGLKHDKYSRKNQVFGIGFNFAI